MLFYEMRCSKSCYLCDLKLVALFDVVEPGVFFGNDFLVNWTAEFRFTLLVASYRFFQTIIVVIFTFNTVAVCINRCPSCAYLSACSLKSLSYDIA